MKKFLTRTIAVCLCLMMVSGCAANSALSSGNHPTSPQNIRFSSVSVQWPHYRTVETLVAAAEYIYEGRITAISFDVINTQTGFPATISDNLLDCSIYTIYEVEITASHIGNHTGKVYIRVMGGIEGFREFEQYEALQKVNMYHENTGIQVMHDFEPLKIGDSYLFLTSQSATSYHKIINSHQFAIKIDNSENTDEITYTQIIEYLNK